MSIIEQIQKGKFKDTEKPEEEKPQGSRTLPTATPFDPATMFEKQPPPSLTGEGWGNVLLDQVLPEVNVPRFVKAPGYAFARGVGGPAFRTYEALFGQQYLLAGLAYSKGRLDPDWNNLTPWARILYPGRFGRVTEEAVTGSKNPALNLTVGILADPGNFSAIGAVSKVGKAKGVLKGITNVSDDVARGLTVRANIGLGSKSNKLRKLYTGLDFDKLSDFNLRHTHIEDWLAQSDDVAELTTKLKVIGAKADEIKKIEPILSQISKGEQGMDLVRSSIWLSEKLRRQERVPVGFGISKEKPYLTGWGAPATTSIGSRAATGKVADVIESMEKGMAQLNKNLRIRQIGKAPFVVQKAKKFVSTTEQRSAERMVQAAKDDVGALSDRLTKLSRQKQRAEIWAPDNAKLKGNAATKRSIQAKARDARHALAKQTYLRDNIEEAQTLRAFESSVKALRGKMQEVGKMKLVGIDRPPTSNIIRRREQYQATQEAMNGWIGWKRAVHKTAGAKLAARLKDVSLSENKRKGIELALKNNATELATANTKYNNKTKQLRNNLVKRWDFKKSETGDVLGATRRELTREMTELSHDYTKARRAYSQGVRGVQRALTERPRQIGKEIKSAAEMLGESTTILGQREKALAGIGETYSAVVRNDALTFIDRLKRIAFGEKFLQHADQEAHLGKMLGVAEEKGIPLRTVARAVEDERVGDDMIKFWGKDIGDVAQGIRNWHAETFMLENKYREYASLGMNYLRRKIFRDRKGNSHWDALISMKSSKMASLMKKYNMDLGFVTIKGGAENPLLEVASSAQMHRSTQAPKQFDEWLSALANLRGEAKALGKTQDANEASELMQFLEEMKGLYNTKNFPTSLGPIGFNEKAQKVFKRHIMELFTSKEGRRLGFDMDSPVDDFKIYSEDMTKIMSERAGLRAKSLSSGEVIEKLANDFFFDTIDDAHIIRDIIRLEGGGLVDVKSGLAQRLKGSAFVSPGAKKMEEMLGKIAENKVASPEALDMTADLMIGWTRMIDSGKFWDKFYDPKVRWWTRSVLYGGRMSQIWNDFVGDRYRMWIHGVSPNNIISNKAIQVIIPEGQTFAKNKVWTGMPDSRVVINNGKHKYTKKDLLRIYNAFESGKEYYNSEAVLAEVMQKMPSDEAQGIGLIFNMASLRKGDVIPGSFRARKFNEMWGRMSTLIDSLEKGMPPIEAAERVGQIHMDYSKMNMWARRAFPFYYWTYRNTPDMFKKMLTVPGKMVLPPKAHTAVNIWNQDELPLEDATPRWLEGAGVWISNRNGKDFYFDMNQIPSYAALDVTGLLNNPEGLDQIFSEGLLQQIAMMSAPAFQFSIEEIMNKQVLYGRPIVSGGTGPIPERGIEQFLGVDVSGNKVLQRGAHFLQTFLPPLEIAEQNIRYARTMPTALAAARIGTGAPIRATNPLSNIIGRTNERINILRIKKDIAESHGNWTEVERLEEKMKELRESNNEYIKTLHEQREMGN